MDNISHHKQNLEPWLFNCSCVGSMYMQYNMFPHHKEDPINCLLHGFMQFHICFLIYSSGNLDLYSVASNCNAWVLIIGGIFEFQYGAAIAAAFQCALHSVALLPVIYPLSELPGSVMQLTSSGCEPIKLMSKRVSKTDILSILQNILWCACPCYKWTIKSCASAIVDLMTCHCFYLQLSSYDLECASLLPAEFSLPFSSGNQESKITSILKHATKMQKVENKYLPTQSIINNWPLKVKEIVVLDLLLIAAKVTFVDNKRFVVSVVWNAMKVLLIMIYFRCGEYHLSLKSKCLPKFTLANKLWQGTLPYWFHNLT